MIMIVGSIGNILDGNIYLVSQGENIRQTQQTDFDVMINQISSGSESLDDIFKEVSDEYGVDLNLLKAVAKAESDFDTEAVSSCGAQGIMQLMPTTAQSLGVEDPFDARQNITGGAKMLAYLLDDYNGNVSLALAAYNAGSGAVSRYGGVPPYNETLRYIDRINDILGGVLSNDSRTIDGAAKTDMSGSEAVEDTGIMVSSSSASEQSDAVSLDKNGLNRLRSQITANRAYVAGQRTSYTSSGYRTTRTLLDYDDYKYVMNTYKAILSKLFSVSDNQLMNYYKTALTVAVTVVVPALLPITSPEEDTVHTLGLLLLHVILSSVPITSRLYLSYCSILILDVLIASEWTVQEASTPLLLLITNTSAVPGPTVVMTPS